MKEFQWLYSLNFLLYCQFIMELILCKNCSNFREKIRRHWVDSLWARLAIVGDLWLPSPDLGWGWLWLGVNLQVRGGRARAGHESSLRGRGPGARPGPGRGRGRAWSGPGHGGWREAGRRGTEDTRTLGPGPLTRVRVRRDLSEPRIEPETSGEWPHSDSGLGWAPRLSQ